jgi:hypothetical protein
MAIRDSLGLQQVINLPFLVNTDKTVLDGGDTHGIDGGYQAIFCAVFESDWYRPD